MKEPTQTKVKPVSMTAEQLVNCKIHPLKDEAGAFVINARGGVVPPTGAAVYTSTKLNQVLGKVISLDVEIEKKKETIKPGELEAKTAAGAIVVGVKYSPVTFMSTDYFALTDKTDFDKEVDFKLPFELQLKRE